MKEIEIKILLGLFFVGLTASAQTPVSTQNLQEMCQGFDRWKEASRAHDSSRNDPVNGAKAAFCSGYIEAWSEAVQEYPVSKNKQVIGCVAFRQGMTNEQVELIFMKYVSAHPESLSKLARDTLQAAMTDADILALRLNDGTWMPKPTTMR